MNSSLLTARRAFLKASLPAAVPAMVSGLQAGKVLKVGLVGCGGRGTGAAAQAMKADDYAHLTAVADIDLERAQQCLERLKAVAGAKVQVEPRNIFVGLDAYQKVIDSGVDVVLLATPPGFRPQHLRASIEAGKHVFCEKPVAVDAPGVRSVLDSARLAQQKNLSIVSGFCWRYSAQVRATFEQIKSGAIGNVVAYYATYYTSPVKPMPPASSRPAGMSDVEWMIRNWYNFTFLSGDGLVEQAVHSVDKIAWAMDDKPPLSCVAVGGRQIPAEGGNIFDHFAVNYLYPNNVRAFLGCRQMEGCYNENADYILGTKGTCTIGRGPNPRIQGEKNWTYSGPRNDMYQAEHDALFASIRRGQPVNDGIWMATSTMLAIMGRMAAYTGQQISWDQALQSQEKLFPDKLDWNGTLEVPPLARPGVTKFL
ncbi:MAG: Gfo/Idh/MocA family oxidoreductase [Bryobacteraceae bacterium]|nr:Gfo/Idh/MocA family oxidoreductase [Bryobacteraceae bacterium]MDW8377293.1 Gfo/Idh/MocA family oxidoreductase [Bryobacterales bacterium]